MKTKYILKILFLTLIFASSSVFAQSQKENQAYKFFEYGKASNSLMKEKVTAFYETLRKEQSSQGCIINYGADKDVAKREAQIRKVISGFRYNDELRITFINGGNKFETGKTVLWIVPSGVTMPQP